VKAVSHTGGKCNDSWRRRVLAEWFRLQLKEKTWKGLKEHTAQGWNLGKVPYGYLPERITHPNPSKATQGLSKTRLALDHGRAPIVALIYAWRVEEKLGIKTITARLNADPAAYPPPDPQAGWSIGGVAALLRNPKYTGYQVIGRRRKGRLVPIDQWHWSAAASHPAIIDRATWDAAQKVAPSTPPPGTAPTPTPPRTARMRCGPASGARSASGACAGSPKPTRTGPAPATPTTCASTTPPTPGTWPPPPDHPRTVSTREDLLVDVLRAGLAAYALSPGRKERLAALLPTGAAAKKAKTDTQATTLHKRLKQIDTAQDSLIHDLHILSTDPADTAAHAMRKRIHAHFTDLHHQREAIEADLKALASDTGRAHDTDLLDGLPELAGTWTSYPSAFRPNCSPRSTFRSYGTRR